jgi:phage-related protein
VAGAEAAGGMGNIKTATSDAASSVGRDAENIAGDIGGIGGASGRAEKRVAEDTKKMEGHTHRLSGLFKKLGESTPGGGGFFSNLASKMPSGNVFLGAAAGLGLAAGGMTDLAMKYQAATTTLAANADISVAAATKITNAFLNTAGKTIYSGSAITTAYAAVAAQLQATQGHALSSAQAMSVMQSAMDLAEATGTSLSTTTGNLATVMMAYGVKAAGAAHASDVLFESARESGIQISTLTSTLTRMHTQLGVVTPPLAQTGALLVDLAHHGETGRQALSAVQSAMSQMLTKGTTMTLDLQRQNAAWALLNPQVQQLIQAHQDGAVSTAAYDKVLATLSGTVQDNVKAYTAAVAKFQSAKTANDQMGISVYNASGQFVGMGSVIEQLDAKLKGHNQEQQLAILQAVFGAQANRKLLEVVQAGPAAYEGFTEAVSKAGTAHVAAAKQAQTLQHELDMMGVAAEDVATKIGLRLIPVLTKVVNWIAQAVATVIKDWPQISAVIKKGWEDVEPALALIWKAIERIVSYLVSHKPVLIAVLAAIALAFSPWLVAIAAVLLGVTWIIKKWSIIKDFYVKLWDEVAGAFERGWDRIKGVVLPVYNVIKDVVMVGLKLYMLALRTELRVLEEAFKVAWDVIKVVVKGAWDAVGPIFNSIIAAIKAIENAIKFVVDLPGKIGSVLGHIPGAGLVKGVSHFLSHPFGLAEGGIYSKPTLAMVGEAGPEVLLPLNDINRSMDLLQQSGLLSSLQQALMMGAAAAGGIGFGGGTTTINLPAGAGQAGQQQQFNALMARLLDVYDVLRLQAERAEEQVAAQKDTTRAVGAAAGKIAGGIVTQADKQDAELAQLLSRRVR